MRITSLLLILSLLFGCASRPTAPGVDAPPPSLASALQGRQDLGRVVILAQPSADDLAQLRGEGVLHIVNLRTDSEMASLGDAMNEPELAASLGMHYAHVPVGGSSGWPPQAVQALADALAKDDGRVLLHCASGARAALVHAAYRIRYEGIEPMQAMLEVEPAGVWPLSLQKLSGVPLRLVRDEP
jgi:uncharacterized protein (TIGR01244 family)